MGMGGDWGEYEYRVVSREMVTPVIAELWLEPTGDAVPYRPGQYVLLSDTAFRVPQRSYSVANAPRADGLVSILVTYVEGGVTSTWATRLARYDEILLEGPFGTFVADRDRSGPVLLLGGGSGLAPLRALAEALLGIGSGDDGSDDVGGAGDIGGAGDGRRVDDGPDTRSPATQPRGQTRDSPGQPPPRPRAVTLIFSGRTEADAIDRALFEHWQREYRRFTYLLTRTREVAAERHTRIPEMLPKEFETLTGVEVFTSGPAGLVAGCQAAARALGAAATDIHTEEFFVDPQPWGGDMPGIPNRR